MTEKRKPLLQSLAAAIVGMFAARGLPTRNTVTRGIANAPKNARRRHAAGIKNAFA